MKMTKDERDDYVQKLHQTKTNKQLAHETGWSETTIKSVKTRLGLTMTKRRQDIIDYCKMHHERESVSEMAVTLQTKTDTIRDVLKLLGLWVSPSEIARDKLVEYLDEHEFSLVSEYTKAGEQVVIGCNVCGHTQMKRANNIMPIGVSCVCGNRTIARGHQKIIGTNEDTENYFYIARLSNGYIKVGVSVDPDRRLKEVCRSANISGVVVHTYTILLAFKGKLDVTAGLEREFKERLSDLRVPEVFNGSTEVFSISDKFQKIVLQHPLLPEIF